MLLQSSCSRLTPCRLGCSKRLFALSWQIRDIILKLPITWIKRDLSAYWDRSSLPVRILQGPRQAGKTSFLEHHAPEAQGIRLDDLAERRMAQADPALFL